MKNCIPIALLSLLLAGCGPDPTTILQRDMTAGAPQVPVSQSHRVTVTLLDVFTDELAYGNRRGIYLIHDTTTGADYVGVSGVGISELGSHRSGKTTVSDER